MMTNVQSTGAPTIKEKRLIQAVAMSNENKFKHPDEDEWARILKAVEKDKESKTE